MTCREMVPYRLPDGSVVPVDVTAAKDAPEIDYQLRGGAIVKATKAHDVLPVTHHRGECDESCRYCATCYQSSGLEICDKQCEHKYHNYPDGWPEE